ncbi:MAG TPA: L,D-transpeptidase family protein [Dokdonella sp.]
MKTSPLIRCLFVLGCAPAAACAAPGVAASPAHAAAPADASSTLTRDAVNAASADAPLKPGEKGAAVLRAQVLLDRAHFSPGEIDASYGTNMRRAIAGFQASHGLNASGEMDAPTWAELQKDGAPALIDVTLSDDDVAGPFQPIPDDLMAQAKLDALTYASPIEKLGEIFHVSPDLLGQLNPGKDFGKAGETLVVPNVRDEAPLPAIARVVVDRSDSTVALVDEGGTVVAQYPASTGSSHDPLPIGQWKILGVGHDPDFHYNPKLFWDAKSSQSKAVIKPGPNNPVGVVWIDLSKPHYGIHGTPEPSHVGKTQSHGCIRLTNWSALEVSRAVKPNMPAILQP